MEIWLDTVDTMTIQEAHNLEILDGVTTNPTLVAEKKTKLEDLITELLNAQEGPLAVQVVAETAAEMVALGKDLYNISKRIIVKIPASKEGYPAMLEIMEDGIPVMATAIFEPYQVYMALKLGVQYVAPYLGRIEDSGKNPKDVLRVMQEIKRAYGFEGKILAAGIRSLDHFTIAANLGIDAITLPKKVFQELIGTPIGTKNALKSFALATSANL